MDVVKFSPMETPDEAINDELEKLALRLVPGGTGKFIFMAAKGEFKSTICSNVAPTVALGIAEATVEMLSGMAPAADQVLEMLQGDMEVEEMPSCHPVKH